MKKARTARAPKAPKDPTIKGHAHVTQGHILKALNRGGVIRVEFANHPLTSTRRRYRLHPGDEHIKEELFQRMLSDGLIKPNADGLFGNDGPVQTYTLWRSSEGGA